MTSWSDDDWLHTHGVTVEPEFNSYTSPPSPPVSPRVSLKRYRDDPLATSAEDLHALIPQEGSEVSEPMTLRSVGSLFYRCQSPVLIPAPLVPLYAHAVVPLPRADDGLPPVAMSTTLLAPPKSEPTSTAVTESRPAASVGEVPLRSTHMRCTVCYVSQHFYGVYDVCEGCKRKILGAFQCTSCGHIKCAPCITAAVVAQCEARKKARDLTNTPSRGVNSQMPILVSTTTVSAAATLPVPGQPTVTCVACQNEMNTGSLRGHWRSEKHWHCMQNFTGSLRFCSRQCTSVRMHERQWVSLETHQRNRGRGLRPMVKRNVCTDCGGEVVETQ
jgi:hypothetical protein